MLFACDLKEEQAKGIMTAYFENPSSMRFPEIVASVMLLSEKPGGIDFMVGLNVRELGRGNDRGIACLLRQPNPPGYEFEDFESIVRTVAYRTTSRLRDTFSREGIPAISSAFRKPRGPEPN